ncbi:hypothetical protein IQ266_25440 [filamentous cyanobacterium LEGE 11480]|uniref:Uncharacterized protein n=1 Tax=Romeriopsis navalis LEGE 11480 TaxID=2777977 RepID=A0A928VV07_9CYAN|nr:hypothetical protein [Romeriopsis navalis]MBE9033085.1 hypothetical protein [Romeriopsis navalis LEGE 11480]
MRVKFLAGLGLASALTLNAALPAIAMSPMSKTVVPMVLPMNINTAEGEWEMYVPDRNPSRALYGGRLKAMDVYVAKMYEVSHHMCSTGRQSPQLSWRFRAAQGPGKSFRITCKAAGQVARAYGLGDREATPIYFSYEEAGGERKTVNIPILKISSGQKLTDWVAFTANLRNANNR